jgi:predicted DNA-binding protein
MALEHDRPSRPQRTTARSVRLAAEEDARVRRAAKAVGLTASDLMREAILARCDAILGNRGEELDDIIGAIDVSGPRARDAGAIVGEAIAEKLAKRRRLS